VGGGDPAGALLALAGWRADNGRVQPVVVIELVIVVLIPTAVGYALVGSVRAGNWFAQIRYRRRYHQQAVTEPIERLGASLRRLRVQLDALETSAGVSAKHARLTALRGAYSDALADACRRLEVEPPPGGARAPQAEIYRAEAALRLRGLDVREPAAR
jgi:HPt (histidine-containing phosphotransfer) domain-containing protein